MRITTSQYYGQILSPKRVNCLFWVEEELLPQVVKFHYFWVLFKSEGKVECDIDALIGAAVVVWKLK